MRKACLAALVAVCLVPAARASGPISTSVYAPTADPLMLQRIHESGSTLARINVSWAEVAPKFRSAGFVPANPADPGYNWTVLDAQVKSAVEHGLTPYLTIWDAPLWAQKDEPHPTVIGPYRIASWKPDPTQFGAFARALALRYDGTFSALPRVRYFEVWDEPNLSLYLSPQLENGNVVAGDIYRGLLNAFAGSVHAVHSDNVVIAGSLSGFSFLTPYGRLGIAPLLFLRKLLCMSAGRVSRPTCKTKVDLDAVSIHPWTSGSPTHHASEKDDVSLGDLPELRRLLDAAFRAGQIRSSESPHIWITEFAWDTRPPDPNPLTAPLALQARWVSEAIYQAWKNNVRVFTWLQLWDQLYIDPLQSGLFFRNGENFRDARPKPAFYAFRFPFVAYRKGKDVSVWGRTPYEHPGKVAVQRKTAAGWRWAGTFTTDRYGVFQGHVRYKKAGKQREFHPSASGSTYRDQVVSAAPMSYWPLNERTGTNASDLTKTNNGTYMGAVKLGVPGPMPGTTAASFNGKTARVQLGRIPGIHSVELWLKTRTSKDAVAFSNRNTNHEFVAFGVVGGMAHAQDSYPIFARTVSNGQWHHLVYTYDTATSTGKVYVDGKLSQLAVWQRLEGGANASIAFDASLKSYFGGQIAQVAVYPYVLSQAQVKSHYQATGRRVAPDTPVGYLRALEVGSKTTSLPFSLVRPRDRFVLPFGGGGTQQ